MNFISVKRFKFYIILSTRLIFIYSSISALPMRSLIWNYCKIQQFSKLIALPVVRISRTLCHCKSVERSPYCTCIVYLDSIIYVFENLTAENYLLNALSIRHDIIILLAREPLLVNFQVTFRSAASVRSYYIMQDATSRFILFYWLYRIILNNFTNTVASKFSLSSRRRYILLFGLPEIL